MEKLVEKLLLENFLVGIKEGSKHSSWPHAIPRKRFTVKPMNASEFYSFSELVKQHTHRKKDSDGKAVLNSKATWINFGQANK